MKESRLGYTPPEALDSRKRAQLRERGFRDGRAGRAKASTDPEYLTSYRRGREQREKS